MTRPFEKSVRNLLALHAASGRFSFTILILIGNCQEYKSGNDRAATGGQSGSAGWSAGGEQDRAGAGDRAGEDAAGAIHRTAASGSIAGVSRATGDGAIGGTQPGEGGRASTPFAGQNSLAGSVANASGAANENGGRSSSEWGRGGIADDGANGDLRGGNAAAAGTRVENAGVASVGERAGANDGGGHGIDFGGFASAGQGGGGSLGTAGGSGTAGIPSIDAHIDDLQDALSVGPVAIAKTVTRWSDVIDVCFLPPSGKDTGFSQLEQDAIRKAVTDSWGRVAKIELRNFGICLAPPATQSRVKVQVDRSLPSQVLGKTDKVGDPGPSGAFTTVSFRDPHPSERTVIHVFGHVLGFLHPISEHACDQEMPPASVEIELSRSVMSQNSCYAAATLTPADIVAAQNAYSRRSAGSLVGMNAQCLDIYLPIEGSCSPVQVYECHGGDNQQWRVFPDGTFLSPAYPNLLLDVYNGNTVDGTLVMVCGPNPSPTANQTWVFQNVELRGIGNLCLDWSSSGMFTGQTLQIQECSGESSQRWRVEWRSTSVVRLHAASYDPWCVQASEDNGTNLQMAPCDSDAHQTFDITALGELKYHGLCWSSAGGDVRNGQPVLLESCLPDGNGNRHQQFFLRGTVLSNLGKCLTTSTFDFKTHDPLYSYTCAGTADFVWDYYFNPP